jgi:hypothetical protein
LLDVARTTIIPKDVAQTREHLIAKLDLLKTSMEIGEMFELLEQYEASGKSLMLKKTKNFVWRYPVSRISPSTPIGKSFSSLDGSVLIFLFSKLKSKLHRLS